MVVVSGRKDQAATTTAGSTTSEPRTTSADAEPESTTAPSTAPEEPATKQQLPTHLLTAIRDFNKAKIFSLSIGDRKRHSSL